jgi:hypothetical protein
MPNLQRSGIIADVHAGRLLRGTVVVRNGVIAEIIEETSRTTISFCPVSSMRTCT